MAPERNMTGTIEKHEEADSHTKKETVTSPPLEMADDTLRDKDINSHSNQTLPIKNLVDKESEVSLESYPTTSNANNSRTESTATDDSGIAAEFDDQNLDDDNESVLGNSQNNGLKSCISCSSEDQSSPVNSPRKSDCVSHEARTPHRYPSTEDENKPSVATRWWSPHRAVCSESLDSIAAQRRKRSKENIGKRTAWLKERTETALEKSAVVRKRSAELIQTGKRLRNEEV